MLRGLNASRSDPAEPQEKKTDRACVIEDGTGRTACGVLVEEMPPTSPGLTKKGLPEPDLPYNRLLYGSWVDEDGDCQNTRAEVLIRDNDFGVVEFKTLKKCRVVSGTWSDPYTDEVFQQASQLDIDHVVPLKNAHQSGAWAWSPEKKREFANYLDNDIHLLAVSASENRRKGAKGPDEYLPPATGFHCEYVRMWVSIKSDWKLAMSASEKAAVEQVMENCSP